MLTKVLDLLKIAGTVAIAGRIAAIFTLCIFLMTATPAHAYIDLFWWMTGFHGAGSNGPIDEPDKPDHGWLPGQGPGGWMGACATAARVALL